MGEGPSGIGRSGRAVTEREGSGMSVPDIGGRVIKVGIVYSGSRHYGGTETYLEMLFSGYDRSRIVPRLFALGEWELTDRIAAMEEKVTILPSLRIRPRTIAELADKLVSADYDVVVTQGTVANFYGRQAARRAHKPVVTIVHSELVADHPSSLVRAAYRLADRLTRASTTRFVTVSHHLKEVLVRSGVAAKDVAVVYSGVPDSETVARLRSDISQDPRIVSIGRLHPVKNYGKLIEAFADLPSSEKTLHIWGTGPLRQALARTAFRHGVHDRVFLDGYKRDVFADPDAMDIYAQPSLSEGFGFSVVEAMSAGIPVVVTPVGSLPELVEDGVSGVVARGTNQVHIKVALERLIGDPDLRRACASGGRLRARELFGVERWLDELAAILEKVASRARS